MKQHALITGVVVMVSMGLVSPLWAVTNQTVTVVAKAKDNPQQNAGDVEGHFTNAPTGDKDEIHVTNNNVKGKDTGVYNDPVNDGAILAIAQEGGSTQCGLER